MCVCVSLTRPAFDYFADLTQEKLNVLLSEEVELRRQLEHVDWIETFLDQEREEVPFLF